MLPVVSAISSKQAEGKIKKRVKELSLPTPMTTSVCSVES
jgi:hypothetical protein